MNELTERIATLIAEYHRADTTEDIEAVQSAVVTNWVVAYEYSNVVGERLAYGNSYITADSASPNTAVGLLHWAEDQVQLVELPHSVGDDDDRGQ
jgi:hypothetical protein